MDIKKHASSSQIVHKKNRKVIGIGNSNDKRLFVNKSGAMMLIKKAEKRRIDNNLIANTLSNQNIIKNNYIISKKNNNVNICSSFRQNNNLGNMGSKLQNTISFANNIMSKANISGLYNFKKSGTKNENMNNFYNNNVLTSANMSLL